MDESVVIKKYPKSKKGFQCLGPCIYPKTMVIHPLTLDVIVDNDNAVCPVQPYVVVDPKTGKKEMVDRDICYEPIRINRADKKELELNLLLPTIDFNILHFLNIFYNIFTFEDGLDWIIKNNFKPHNTKERIFEMTMKTYGKDIDLIDTRTTDFFAEIIKKKYLGRILKKIGKHIIVEDDKVYIDKNPLIVNLDKKNNVVKINFIIEKFINTDTMSKFIIRYIKQKKNIWETIQHQVIEMVYEFTLYILQKINMTLDKED